MLIKFGSIVVNGRGKLGGHVYSKNRGGAYVRTLQTPSNPRTSFQQSGRAVFTQLTQGWSSLTDSQRNGWNIGTENFTRTDVFGDTRKLSGKGLYISLNKELILVGKQTIDDCPSPGPIVVPSEIDTVVEIASTSIDPVISVEGGAINYDDVVITTTGKVSNGTTFITNKLVVLDAGSSTSNDVGLYNNYIARFGEPVAGDKIFFGVYTVNDVGQRSPMVTNFAAVS